MENWIVQHGEALQLVVFFGLFTTLAVAESIEPLRTGDTIRRSRWFVNLVLTLLNLVALGLIPITFVGAARWAEESGVGLINVMDLSPIAIAAATLLARAFISFFTHYLMHTIPLFWLVHRVHHLDTELDVSTTVRFHPLEFAIALIPGLPLVVLLGLSPWVLLWYEVLDAAITLFSHANISLPRPVERAIRYAIVTPDLHRIHHSSWQPETDSNFGAVFPVWDIVFGTFRAESRIPQAEMDLGLEEPRDERTRSLSWLLLSGLTYDHPKLTDSQVPMKEIYR